ncbi:hypothetical protein QF001_003737 [Paraburkholderia youngii]|uniref:hypothetical protein n=1 Tax=Paraburkholderia youngii TaxID=2782701 RepID=UPI003D24500A
MKLTLNILPVLSRQDVFDLVATHLLKQRARSLADYDGILACVYRAPDGKRCAVGAVIPDEAYDESLENRSVRNLVERLPRARGPQGILYLFLSAHYSLLSALQALHDNNEPEEWPAGLHRIAREFELRSPVERYIQRLPLTQRMARIDWIEPAAPVEPVELAE